MSLGEVCEVKEVRPNGTALVAGDKSEQEVLLMTIHDDDVSVGDWVVCHSGFALERLSAEQAKEAKKAGLPRSSLTDAGRSHSCTSPTD